MALKMILFIKTLVEQLPTVVANLNKFSQVILTKDQQTEFAIKAVEARFGEEKQLNVNEIVAAHTANTAILKSKMIR